MLETKTLYSLYFSWGSSSCPGWMASSCSKHEDTSLLMASGPFFRISFSFLCHTLSGSPKLSIAAVSSASRCAVSYVCMHVSMYVYVYTCICSYAWSPKPNVCMHVSMYVCICSYVWSPQWLRFSLCRVKCMHACKYIRVCVYMYVLLCLVSTMASLHAASFHVNVYMLYMHACTHACIYVSACACSYVHGRLSHLWFRFSLRMSVSPCTVCMSAW